MATPTIEQWLDDMERQDLRSLIDEICGASERANEALLDAYVRAYPEVNEEKEEEE